MDDKQLSKLAATPAAKTPPKEKATPPVEAEETVEPSALEAALELPAASANPSETKQIPLDQIAQLDNERTYQGIDELAATMHAQGQLEPCVVRPAPASAKHGKPYELVFGYRRLRAAQTLNEQGNGFASLRCEIRNYSNAEVLAANITENYQREDPSPLEQAHTMKRLMDEAGLSKREVARWIGCHETHVFHRLKLLALPESVQEKLRDGRINASVAEVIASLPNPVAQEKLADNAVKHEFSVKRASEWAHDVIAKEQEAANAPEPLPDFGTVKTVPATETKRLPLRDNLTDEDIQRLALTALLRNGQDYELLDYLQEVFGYSQDHLYSYTETLSDDEVRELLRQVVQRFWRSPHRLPTLEERLVEFLSVPTTPYEPPAEKPLNEILPGADAAITDPLTEDAPTQGTTWWE
jgi:ParB/RepB/Spo0J family partition protein